MIRPTIVRTYWFRSSRDFILHETLRYEDGTTSCNCLGWTLRTDKNGNRSCKHTRMVEAGIGAQNAIRVSGEEKPQPTVTTKTTNPGVMLKPGQRKIITE